ncbi:MAG: DUF1330 domain-containing protein [Acidibrevibacterium sp.]|jgi:uncharacterized protein (DUF1330 family)|uniref:DUF1330 domain-containing protein n=1 Tax=Acidibrevibacterium fodinaquatile TaxID=1969806 RepID=UPI0023A8129C|nr:DUF1330 domain-containing protein [Acidibrevibacterium fodinaquatile]MCA7119099.1 DUF1330 domain-containing protein [Acidibrevibacterium fodinaquatile]
MPAYVIAQIDVTDPVLYERYKPLAAAAIAAAGGRYLVRGGETAALEGAPPPGRVVVLEFPSVAAARAFYDGPDYAAARMIRERAATSRFFIVEGL